MQGVAFHPTMKLIASASSDATVRIYKNRQLKNLVQFYHKYTIKQREEFEERPSEHRNTENHNSEPQIDSSAGAENKE